MTSTWAPSTQKSADTTATMPRMLRTCPIEDSSSTPLPAHHSRPSTPRQAGTTTKLPVGRRDPVVTTSTSDRVRSADMGSSCRLVQPLDSVAPDDVLAGLTDQIHRGGVEHGTASGDTVTGTVVGLVLARMGSLRVV